MDFFIPLAPVSAGHSITIDGVVYRTLRRDANDALQVAVASLPLPTGAATLAEQQTQTTALQLIDDLRTALASVALDQLRADVISSALPTGAATLAEQQTQTTALQLIDDLRTALADVAGDELRVNLITPFVPTSAGSGQTTVTTAGTQVQLPAQACKAVSIAARPANTGNIFLGDSTVDSATGRILQPGDAVDLAIDNLNRLYIDSAVNGEGVSYLWVA